MLFLWPILQAIKPAIASDRLQTILKDSEDKEDQTATPPEMEEEVPLESLQVEGLDCSATSFGASLPADCEDQILRQDSEQVRLKVYQKVDIVKRTAIRCVARTTSIFTGCGMFSHSYLSSYTLTYTLQVRGSYFYLWWVHPTSPVLKSVSYTHRRCRRRG